MDAIEAERCTSIYGTPTMFVDILAAARQKKPDVSHVETGIMAGRGQGQGRTQGVREKARVFETLNFFGKGLTQIETDVQLL